MLAHSWYAHKAYISFGTKITIRDLNKNVITPPQEPKIEGAEVTVYLNKEGRYYVTLSTRSSSYTYTVDVNDPANDVVPNTGGASGGVTFVTLTSIGQAITIPTTGVSGFALTQGSGGSKTVSWPEGIRWDGGTVPTLSTTAGSTDVFTFVSVPGSGWLGKKESTYASASVTSDTTAPSAISGLTAGTATTTTVPLSWTAATDNVGVTGYEYSTNGTTYSSTGSTGTTYTITGLTAGTAYTLYIRAYDAAGNRGAASSVNKTTAASADTTAPSTVTGLTAGTVTSTTIPLTWTAATDNVAVTGYEYSTNGTTWVSTGSTSTAYTVTGLTASTNYTVQIRAFDAAGNRGTAASVASTTAAAGLAWVSMASDTFTAADGTVVNGRAMETGGLTYSADVALTIQNNKADWGLKDNAGFATPEVVTGSNIHRVTFDYDISGQKNGNTNSTFALVWSGGTRTGANPTRSTAHQVKIAKAAYNSAVATMTGTTPYGEALTITAQNGQNLSAVPLTGTLVVETLADGLTINVKIDGVLWATVSRLAETMTVGQRAYGQIFAAWAKMDNLLIEAYK